MANLLYDKCALYINECNTKMRQFSEGEIVYLISLDKVQSHFSSDRFMDWRINTVAKDWQYRALARIRRIVFGVVHNDVVNVKPHFIVERLETHELKELITVNSTSVKTGFLFSHEHQLISSIVPFAFRIGGWGDSEENRFRAIQVPVRVKDRVELMEMLNRLKRHIDYEHKKLEEEEQRLLQERDKRTKQNSLITDEQIEDILNNI